MRLLEAAQRGCFIDQTLRRPNRIVHRLRVGERFDPVGRDAPAETAVDA